MGKDTTGIHDLLRKYGQYVRKASDPVSERLVSMGSLSINIALGNPNGIPAGKIVQIIGNPSNGKTTLALSICAQHQRMYPDTPVMFVDFERAFNADYARRCGIDLDALYVVYPDFAEQGMDIVEDFIDRGATNLVIIDSVPMAVPKEELEKDFTERPKVASSAQLITRLCNRVVQLLSNRQAMLILINQYRKNFSTLARESNIPFGGYALQYASNVILSIQYHEPIPDYGFYAQVTVKKSRVGTPNARATVPIRYGYGIDHRLDVFNLALERGIIERSGSWYVFNGMKVQGIQNACASFPTEALTEAVLDYERQYVSGDV